MTDREEINDKRWNVFSLKEYLDLAISSLSDKLNLINQNNADALNTAKDELDRRLEGMNDIRKQLNDQARTFLERNVFDAEQKLTHQKIDGIQKILWVGLGVWLVLQSILVVVLVLVFKR